MNSEKEKLDILLDIHAKAIMERVDWQNVNEAVLAKIAENNCSTTMLRIGRITKYRAVYKIAASVLIIAGVIFTIVAMTHNQKPRDIPYGHASLLPQPAIGKAVVTLDYGRDATAIVRITSSEPAATCTLEIIDLEKYGYKYYKGASYTVIVMKTTNNY